MTVEILREVLLWCSIINIGMLFLFFLIFTLLHDWIYHWHSKWFKLTRAKFDTTYYVLIAFFKMCILFFNIVPYVALRILG
jgi:hypothetical protein